MWITFLYTIEFDNHSVFTGPFKVHNFKQDHRVSQNQLTFWFPNPELTIDDCNERIVQLEKLDPDVEHFDLKIQYESENMRDLGRFGLNSSVRLILANWLMHIMRRVPIFSSVYFVFSRRNGLFSWSSICVLKSTIFVSLFLAISKQQYQQKIITN